MKGIFRVLTSLVSGLYRLFRAARSGAKRHNHRIRLWLNNDDNAMKRKLFWICAVAMGMSAFPSFMTQATPATQPLINAEPAVAAQTEQNPQVGQVMPGVQGADAPVVAQNGPSRDVEADLCANCAAAGQHGATWH